MKSSASQHNKVIVVVGPTASGKTGYSLHLAHLIRTEFKKLSLLNYGVEILSADSRQIYTGLDIGTGKVPPHEMQGIPHHMLDIVEPGEVYSAHRFANEGRQVMEDVWKRGNLPIVCGGTGLYIDALLGRVALGTAGRDDALRAELEAKPCKELFTLLQKEDPARAETIASKGEQTNKVRLVRALEIAKSTESESPKVLEKNVWLRAPLKPDPRTFSKEAFGDERDPEVLWLGLRLQASELRANIKKRLHDRLEHGMLDEVARLHDQGLSWERMETLGLEYRYCARYLQGHITRDELATQLEQKIWQYAKRQINWWQRNEGLHWFHPSQTSEMDALALAFLKK